MILFHTTIKLPQMVLLLIAGHILASNSYTVMQSKRELLNNYGTQEGYLLLSPTGSHENHARNQASVVDQ